jgi:Fe-Mn family superoxide dismutase
LPLTVAGFGAYYVKNRYRRIMMENEYYPFVNLPLPYDYTAMEPYIDAKTMMLHHDRHLQTYINNLNKALVSYPRLQRLSLKELLKYSDRLPREVRNEIINNAGGVYNHRLYFNTLKNPAESGPVGQLGEEITQQFGSIERFLDALKKAALSVFGSGYAWLVSERGRLSIMTTANQDSPIAQGYCPIVTVDVWEHAYYLKHYNVRADYIDDLMNVIDWDKADETYTDCLAK